MRKIAFVNIKGGVGKTTGIFNVAGVLAKQGKKVLCIDLDRQCNLTTAMLSNKESCWSKRNDKTIMDVFEGNANICDVVKQNYIIDIGKRKAAYYGIDIIPGSKMLRKNEYIRKTYKSIRESLTIYAENEGYDYVLCDLPANSEVLNEICFSDICDEIISPFSVDKFSVDGYEELMDVVNKAREKNEVKMLGIYLSKYDSRISLDKFIKEELESFGSIFIKDVQIPSKTDIRETVILGKPISFYKSKSSTLDAYEKLTREIMNR